MQILSPASSKWHTISVSSSSNYKHGILTILHEEFVTACMQSERLNKLDQDLGDQRKLRTHNMRIEVPCYHRVQRFGEFRH